MLLYLVCVTVLEVSAIIFAVPGPPPSHHSTSTTCAVHQTLKEAALAEYERSRTGSISYDPYTLVKSKETEEVNYYKLDVQNKTVVPIPKPKIRVEVDEK